VWLDGERPREGAAGLTQASWRSLVGVWQWGRWLFALLIAPFVFFGMLWGIVLVIGPLCLVLVCFGKPKVAWEVIKAIPSAFVSPNLRGLLIPPRTGLARRAFRAVTRRW
jgi:hypothetical protein